MLLRHRSGTIDDSPATAVQGYEHVSADAVAVLRWLNGAGVDYLLVGAVARAMRGDAAANGPVAIVPAPYGRNLDRLARALNAAHARERSYQLLPGVSNPGREPALRMTAEQLLRPERWTLACGSYELDVEGWPAGSPSYQELLYESVRIEVAQGVAAEVASPEDIEQYDHVRRTGVTPEFTVTRIS